MKRALLSWSSGKDSAWTLHVLRQDPDVDVVGLLTTLNSEVDRVAMHGVRRELLQAQADEARLPLITLPLPSPCSNADYERIMTSAIADAAARGVTHMAFGDLFLEDVRDYRIRMLHGTGIEPLFPIWCGPHGTRTLAHEMIASGVRAVVTCVDTTQVPDSILGREFDESLLADLPNGADPCAEKGEFHTCCYAGPMYARPLAVERGERVDRDRFQFIDLSIADRVVSLA